MEDEKPKKPERLAFIAITMLACLALTAIVYKFRAEESFAADALVNISPVRAASRAVPARPSPTPMVIIRYVTRQASIATPPASTPTGAGPAIASPLPAGTKEATRPAPPPARHPRLISPETARDSTALANSYSVAEQPVIPLPHASAQPANFTPLPAPSINPTSAPRPSPTPKKRSIWKHAGIFGHP